MGKDDDTKNSKTFHIFRGKTVAFFKMFFHALIQCSEGSNLGALGDVSEEQLVWYSRLSTKHYCIVLSLPVQLDLVHLFHVFMSI